MFFLSQIWEETFWGFWRAKVCIFMIFGMPKSPNWRLWRAKVAIGEGIFRRRSIPSHFGAKCEGIFQCRDSPIVSKFSSFVTIRISTNFHKFEPHGVI